MGGHQTACNWRRGFQGCDVATVLCFLLDVARRSQDVVERRLGVRGQWFEIEVVTFVCN